MTSSATGATFTEYHAKLYAHEISRRYPSSDVEKLIPSLMGARVDLNPHQIDAALFAFRSPLSKGAILADEVGLGKTIEAGIVLSQLWAERKRSIIIIAPASLRTQWEQELWDKFSLPSFVLDRKGFITKQTAGQANPFEADGIVIASYAFARKHANLLQSINWDLVVIDEAHRLRNVYKKGSSIAKDLQRSLAHSKKLLLTATPLHNSLMELYGLVSFVDPHIFNDSRTFRAQYSGKGEDAFEDLKRRLAPVCKRTLRRQVLEYVRYTERIPHTEDFTPTRDEEELYNRVSEYLRRDRLWTLPSGQRSLMILVLRKLLASSSFAIAGALKTMVQRLDLLLHTKDGNGEVKDNLSLVEDFEGAGLLTEEEVAVYHKAADHTSYLSLAAHQEQEEIRTELASLQSLLAKAEGITNNAKGEALLQALATGFTMMEERGAASKAVIFTESKRTQEYLFQLLCQNGYEGKVLLFNGTNNGSRANAIYREWKERHAGTDKITGSRDIDVRKALVEEFRERAQIMIATEAASEGINLQFCSLVINYDLPWNPQRIEQRIGRCHRYGQKHDVVVINFLNRNNAADQRVFELLSDKFRLFSGIFGASDEVLGSIESGVDFEKRIADIYQNCRTPEQIQKAFDDLRDSLSEEIEENLLQARKKLLENFDVEVAEKLQVYKADVTASLDRQSTLLWDLTQYMISLLPSMPSGAPAAACDGEKLEIQLEAPPLPTISKGLYGMGSDSAGHIYHPSTPLAQWVIESASSLNTPSAHLHFILKGKNISILDDLQGKSGFVAVHLLTLKALDVEDHFLLGGVTDGGQLLEVEQVRRLFDLPASVSAEDGNHEVPDVLVSELLRQRQSMIEAISQRNSDFFDEEMEKLDRWAEDRKNQLTMDIDDIDQVIKQKKADARKTAKLEEKVALQREVKSLEARRTEMRKRLFEAQDQVDGQKDELLNTIEKRMHLEEQEEPVFSIRWSLS